MHMKNYNLILERLQTFRSEKTEIFLLGIIGDEMRAALETLGTIIAVMYRGLMGSPNYTRK